MQRIKPEKSTSSKGLDQTVTPVEETICISGKSCNQESTKRKIPSYIAHVDGLRTIAISCVITYHAWPEILPGGYVGVDMFFVISGYLISGIIFRQHANKSFTYSDFYSRRICRIYPALLPMLYSLIGMICNFFSAEEIHNTAKTLIATTIFSANLQLEHLKAGYLGPDLKKNPLLHMWSLGVEEQYYILWPIIALIIIKYSKETKMKGYFMLFIFLFISFIFNVSVVAPFPKLAFYCPLSRFWQMTVGCILAYMKHNNISEDLENASNSVKDGDINEKNHDNGHDNERSSTIIDVEQQPLVKRIQLSYSYQINLIISTAGLLLICLSISIIDETKQIPGWWALLPTLGVALTIYASPEMPFNYYILGSRPFIFVGKISYPLYLWHWPLLVLMKTMYPGGGSNLMAKPLTMIVISIILSILTYYGIEKKLRQRRTRLVLTSLIAAMGIVTLIGILMFINSSAWALSFHQKFAFKENTNDLNVLDSDGICSEIVYLPFDPNTTANSARGALLENVTVDKIKEGMKSYDMPYEGENLSNGKVQILRNFDFDNVFFLNSTKGKNTVMIIGDSHALAAWGRYRWLWNKAQEGKVFLNGKVLAMPSMHLWLKTGWVMMRCRGYNEEYYAPVADYVLSHIKEVNPTNVVLMFRYSGYLNKDFPGPNPNGPPSKPDHEIPKCIPSVNPDGNANTQQTTADTEWLLRTWVADVKKIIDMNITVHFVVASPDTGAYVPKSMYDVSGVRQDRVSYNFSLSEYSNKPYLSFTLELMKSVGAKIVYLSDNLCWNDRCAVISRYGFPVYIDDNHYNTRLATEYLEALDQTIPFSCT